MKKTFFYILIFSFLNFIGCYSSQSVNKEILYTSDLGEPAGIVVITMNNENVIELRKGIYEVVGDTLHVDGFKQYIDHVEPIDVKVVLDEGNYELVDDTLYASGINKTNTTVYGQPIDLKIALDDIHSLEIEELDVWKTTGCIIGGAVAVSLMIAVILTFSGNQGTPRKCQYEGFTFERKKD